MLIADTARSGMSVRSGRESAMKLKSKGATKLTTLLTAVALICVDSAQAPAMQKPGHHDRGSIHYCGSAAPNVSYQSGPHTRIYITNRTWLDAGTEVLPGDRKFTDYAFPPAYSFGRENRTRTLDRQPLHPPSDTGGYPRVIPLY